MSYCPFFSREEAFLQRCLWAPVPMGSWSISCSPGTEEVPREYSLTFRVTREAIGER